MTEPAPALSRAAVDRAAARRTDEAWLAASWAAPATRVLVLEGGHAAVVDPTGAGGRPRLAFVRPADAPAGDRIFLGLAGGTAYWAVVAAPDPTDTAVAVTHAESVGTGAAGGALEGQRRAGLLEVGAALDDHDAGLFVHAVGMANWHASHRHCPRCGAPTEPVHGGHLRACSADGNLQFPRVEPVVIMNVHDGADRCLLGRGPGWPPGRYSCLAGFMEPGESAEHAVAREVAEEVGLRVTDVRYVASQPWPFPGNLMLGFRARVVPADIGGELRIQADELEDARWFSREELRRAARTGADLLPPLVSIARRLLTEWTAG